MKNPPTFVRHLRRGNALFNQGLLTGTSVLTMPPIACGSCAPAAPSRMKERSNPFGPVIFISHRSFAWEPMIETHQSPGRSESTCSMTATTSAPPRPDRRYDAFPRSLPYPRENITDALEAAMARADLDRILFPTYGGQRCIRVRACITQFLACSSTEDWISRVPQKNIDRRCDS